MIWQNSFKKTRNTAICYIQCYVAFLIMKFTVKYLDKKIHKSEKWFCNYTQSYKHTWFLPSFAIILNKGKIILIEIVNGEKIMDIVSENKLEKLIDFVNTT